MTDFEVEATSRGIRRHGVAILAAPQEGGEPWGIAGSIDPKCRNPRNGFVEIIELISAAKYPYEVMDHHKISLETFLEGDLIKYTSIIILPPLDSLSSQAREILGEMSYKHGVSLIYSLGGTAPDRVSPWWGIRKIGKGSLLWPLQIVIRKWPGREHEGGVISKYHPWLGFAGVREKGFRKLDLGRISRKIFRLLEDSFIPFRKLTLDQSAVVLAENTGGFPLVHSFRYGKAINYCFSLGFRNLLGRYNETHRLFRGIIEANSGFGMASVDLDGTMALRIDDPGSCVSSYLDGVAGTLRSEDWERFGAWLAEKGFSASVMYCPRWVDDGDESGGSLSVRGQTVEPRKAGQTFSAPSVRYYSNKKGRFIDHEDEFKGLLALKEKGTLDIQSHGLTHLHPEHERWASSRDRNRNTRWYHEYYNVIDNEPVDPGTQRFSMSASRDEISRFFGSFPLILTPSGHRQGYDTDIEALTSGYLIFSSDITSYRNGSMVIRNSKVPGLFLLLKRPNSCFQKSGYPFVGVVHDTDLSGPDLRDLEKYLQGWMNRGIKRIISLKELAASLCLALESRFCGSPASAKIELRLPSARKGEGRDDFSGARIPLRVVPPKSYAFSFEDMQVSGAKAHSIRMSTRGNASTIFLDTGHEGRIEISIPLKGAVEPVTQTLN